MIRPPFLEAYGATPSGPVFDLLFEKSIGARSGLHLQFATHQTIDQRQHQRVGDPALKERVLKLPPMRCAGENQITPVQTRLSDTPLVKTGLQARWPQV